MQLQNIGKLLGLQGDRVRKITHEYDTTNAEAQTALVEVRNCKEIT